MLGGLKVGCNFTTILLTVSLRFFSPGAGLTKSVHRYRLSSFVCKNYVLFPTKNLAVTLSRTYFLFQATAKGYFSCSYFHSSPSPIISFWEKGVRQRGHLMFSMMRVDSVRQSWQKMCLQRDNFAGLKSMAKQMAQKWSSLMVSGWFEGLDSI